MLQLCPSSANILPHAPCKSKHWNSFIVHGNVITDHWRITKITRDYWKLVGQEAYIIFSEQTHDTY